MLANAAGWRTATVVPVARAAARSSHVPLARRHGTHVAADDGGGAPCTLARRGVHTPRRGCV